MTKPKYDPDTGLPIHHAIPVTADGRGPTSVYDQEFDHWACWCGVEGCTKFIQKGSIFDPDAVLSRDGLVPHQHWVWLNGAKPPFWCVMGTGAVLPDKEDP